MVVKKSELYSSIWKSCDELRGGMDASQYKDYVLVLLFMRYVTDKYAGKPNSDVQIPDGGGFKDIVASKGQPDVGDRINKIIAKFADVNGLNDVFREVDFNDNSKLGDGKDMQDRLSNLISIFQNPEFDFSKNGSAGDDLLGDAYEYLMKNFATESGKSKGQFYTPSEVSQIMARVIGISNADNTQTVYDPTCGSGSLLLKAADETSNGIAIYGQENDVATKALATMNMWLHGYPTAEIWRGNTLSDPHWKNPNGSLKTFDFVVANPPFSTKSWTNGVDPANDVYGRFQNYDAIPPAKNGDYAFLLHMISSMKSTGKAAIILPLGVLFRGNSESIIRKNIVERGYIKGVIALPPNIFYGTGIAASIIVLDKEHSGPERSIFMIAAQDGYAKDGNKNRLRARDIHRIVDVFNNQLEIPKYSRLVKYSEIEKNEFNLNISLYIDTTEQTDLQDIKGHLHGGIPERDITGLESYWRTFPNLRERLFQGISNPGYYSLKIKASDIALAIMGSPEHAELKKTVMEAFSRWSQESKPILEGSNIGVNPKDIVKKLSEKLLEKFSGIELIDNYDIYQDFMYYWNETMQDDLYIISTGGWKAIIEPINNKKGKAVDWECPLLPKQIVAALYFKDLMGNLEKLESELEDLASKKSDLDEETNEEDDLFSEVRGKQGVSKTEIVKRMKEIGNKIEFTEEYKALKEYMELLTDETHIKTDMKKLQGDLDMKLRDKYKVLTVEEIKKAVIETKWFSHIQDSLQVKIDEAFSRLSERIHELYKRYATPLPEITSKVEKLTATVEDNLKELGYYD
ncbi:type I restriction-modification system subunit M [Ferroplasma sp.]|uniref:type I restriction-modification system subunit M n=1 Tax=Ferroplasma sp. TaxID=2591003 RepID=UPI00261E5E93|nr:type I restriction-modification system subunit M [Ferroplasma sp.]